MKILYDHQTFYQRVGGVSRYFTEIFPNLENLGCEIKLSCYFSNNMYLDGQNVKKFFPNIRSGKITMLMQSINQYFSIKNLKKNDYDVFHPTQYSPYYLNKIKKPFVITIHDMVSEIFDIHQVNTRNKKIIIPKSNKIIAISENTKKDILKFYPEINPQKITVIYHGYSQSPFNLMPNKIGNYILFVGQRNGYKNFIKFLYAVIPILQQDKCIQLICTGEPFNENELQILKSSKIISQCHSSYVSDDELYSLYHHAKVFVFPSLYEGFGLPILEAFSNECPVCLSNASCFPELGGDAALYFDPNSIESIRETILNIIYDPYLAMLLRIKGKERVKLFSWEISAEKHYNIYKSLI